VIQKSTEQNEWYELGTVPESELLENLDSIIKNVVSVFRQVQDEAPPTARIKAVPTP